MDDRRFDSLARGLASGRDRRTVLKGLLGLSGLTITGAVALNDVQAARRGTTVPETPTPVPTSVPTLPSLPSETPISATETPACAGEMCNDGCCSGQCTATGACCPVGSTVCGPDCCPADAATCCDGACCYGVCYGEELCCPETSVCGSACCAPDDRCCAPASGLPVCIPAGGCCSDDDCEAGQCLGHHCVTESPTANPTDTPEATSTPIPAGTLSLLLTSDCLAQASLTDFTPGTTLPAVRLFGKISAGDDPVQLDQISNVPITFPGTLTLTFAVDLGGLTYTEVQAEVDTGTTVMRTSWIAVTCIRPTVTPTPTPLVDPRVDVSFGDDCALQVTLTGFGAGTDVRISVVGHTDTPIPFEVPLLFVPSATIGSDGVLILPPLSWDPETLGAVEVQARVTFDRNRFDSDWTPVDCASPAPTMTPSHTATPSITPTPSVTSTPSATRTPGIPWAEIGPTSDCRVQVELFDFPPNSTVPYVDIWGSGDFGLVYRVAVFRDQVQTDSNGYAVMTTWFPVGKRVRRVRATVSSGDIDLETGWSVWLCEPGRRP